MHVKLISLAWHDAHDPVEMLTSSAISLTVNRLFARTRSLLFLTWKSSVESPIFLLLRSQTIEEATLFRLVRKRHGGRYLRHHDE